MAYGLVLNFMELFLLKYYKYENYFRQLATNTLSMSDGVIFLTNTAVPGSIASFLSAGQNSLH